MRKFTMILLLVIFGTMLATQVLAVEAGGKIDLGYGGTWFEDGTFTDQLTDGLDLELYLPPLGETEFSYALRVGSPLQGLTDGQEATYFTKKLYLKHKFKLFHLTVGRQPVSWSFGALLNPVDYTLGAVALDEETNSKYTDALEVYIPLNWNSSLALVTSFPTGFVLETEKMKWGVRGRFGIKGYDLTLNYVQEAAEVGVATGTIENGLAGLIPLPRQRAGFTFKGDLGDLGVYGAFGHYFKKGAGQSNCYLAGVDYSYNLDYYSKLTMQLEYLGLDGINLMQLVGPDSPYRMINSGTERTHLLTGNLVYPLDDFSSLALSAIANLNGSKYMIAPSYQNTLPGNIDLELSIPFVLGGSDDNFTSIAVGLSYSF